MLFSTKHIVALLIGSAAIATAERSRFAEQAEETVENIFVPRRLGSGGQRGLHYPRNLKHGKGTKNPEDESAKTPKSCKGSCLSDIPSVSPTSDSSEIPSVSPSDSSDIPSDSPSVSLAPTTFDCPSECPPVRRLSVQDMMGQFNEEGSIRSYADSYGYEVDLQFGTGEKENVLSKKDCEGLMSLINTYPDDEEYQLEENQIYIDDNELVSIIGKDKFNALLDLHYEVVGATIPLDAIKIRRHMNAVPIHNAYFEYHTDEYNHMYGTKMSAVIVPLNENSAIEEGGELYYLHEHGSVLAARDQGKAFAHSYNVLHGVSPHVGDRVTLFLHFNHDLLLQDVGGRKLTEESRRRNLICRRHVR